MFLLNGHTLARKNWFRPESMNLSLEERSSSATMTLGPEAPALSVGAWLMDETNPGKGIIWRVKAVNESVETRTRTVTLEHIVQSLRDRVMFGEVTPAMITGKAGATTCTSKEACQYILKQVSAEWKIGDVAGSKSAPYSFNGDNLYSALEAVSGSLADVQWEYDLTSVPFTLHIRKIPSGFDSEMRMSRNITTLRRQIDRSRMYTRIYPIGKDNLHISGNYLSKNENLYGIVCKVETDQSQDTEAKLRAWAQERLDRHCEPLVTDTISGMDLSAGTREPLDTIRVGRKCRVPLPDSGTTLIERVVKMTWSDKIREPEKVTVTLANKAEDVASIISNMIKNGSSGKAGRAAAKEKEEDHAWFVDTTEHVGMVAEAVAGPGAAKDWSRVASVMVDGKGVHQQVTETKGDLKVAESRIDMTERSINQTVEAVGKDGKITAASICLAINDSGESEAMIRASKIYLLGEAIVHELTADILKSKIGNITLLETKSVNVRGTLTVSGVTQIGSHVYAAGLHLGTADNSKNVALALLGGSISLSGDTYTLKMFDFNGGEHVIGNFSRATTLTGVWNGGRFIVNASPQGDQQYTDLKSVANADVSWSGRTGTFTVYAYNNGSETPVSTGKTMTVYAPFSSVSLAKAYNIYDNIYYGRLYDSAGNALTNNSYYWYGSSTNYDGGSASATFWRHT